MGIADLDAERFCKTLALALSSDFDGEILASVAASRRQLDASCIQTSDFISFLSNMLARNAGIAGEQSAVIQLINTCLGNWDFLSIKEKDFIFAIRPRSSNLSEKQAKWLVDIASRFMRHPVSGQDAGAGCDTAHQGA